MISCDTPADRGSDPSFAPPSRVRAFATPTTRDHKTNIVTSAPPPLRAVRIPEILFPDSPRKFTNPTSAVARPLHFSRSAAGNTEGRMFSNERGDIWSGRRTTPAPAVLWTRPGPTQDPSGTRNGREKDVVW